MRPKEAIETDIVTLIATLGAERDQARRDLRVVAEYALKLTEPCNSDGCDGYSTYVDWIVGSAFCDLHRLPSSVRHACEPAIRIAMGAAKP